MEPTKPKCSTWTAEDMPYAPAGVKEGDKRFSGGELGMKYIVNDPGDNRYEKYPNAPAYTVLKDGKCVTRIHMYAISKDRNTAGI